MKNKNEKSVSNSQKTENTFVESMATIKNTTVKTVSNAGSEALAFNKKNYGIMIAGILVIMLGFFIMTLDKEDFGFGFMGLTLGPIIAFLGFLMEFYAILKK